MDSTHRDQLQPGEESPWIKTSGPGHAHADTSAEDDSVADVEAIYATRAEVDQCQATTESGWTSQSSIIASSWPFPWE